MFPLEKPEDRNRVPVMAVREQRDVRGLRTRRPDIGQQAVAIIRILGLEYRSPVSGGEHRPTTLDPAERRKLFADIAAIVLKDRPIVYLYHRHWLWAYTNKLDGLRAIPDGLVRVTGARFK